MKNLLDNGHWIQPTDGGGFICSDFYKEKRTPKEVINHIFPMKYVESQLIGDFIFEKADIKTFNSFIKKKDEQRKQLLVSKNGRIKKTSNAPKPGKKEMEELLFV